MLKNPFKFLSSFGLATVLLILLLLLTFVGTLEQVEHGLYASQRKYFESTLIWSIDLGACLRALSIDVGDMKLPLLLPGGYVVMALFALNLTIGGLIRVRKNWKTIGVIISHFAIVFMLVAGAVEFHFKNEGNLALLEGEQSDEFQSYHNRVVEIEQVEPAPSDGKRKVLVIPAEHFSDLVPDGSEGKARTFTHPSLPFELQLKNYQPNCEPKRAAAENKEAVDGYYLQQKPKEAENEKNLDGLYAVAKMKDGTTQDGLLWGVQAAPWIVKAEGKTFAIDLTRERWKLPFTVRLDKFEREFHPGTQRPRKFTSYVTKNPGEKEEKRIVTMNEPVRDSGFVVFQASFSMDPNDPGAKKRSVFAVVQNPSDKWPEYACYVVAFGLMVHFIMKLLNFMGVKASGLLVIRWIGLIFRLVGL